MSPEEFIRQNVDIKTASIAHLLDSDFVRNLLNTYANIRIAEHTKEKK